MRALFFDEADANFMLFDEDFFLIDVNASFLRTLQINRSEAIGQHLSNFCSDILDVLHVEKLSSVMWTGMPYYIEVVKSHRTKGRYLSTIKAFKAHNALAIVLREISLQDDQMQERETFIYRSSHDMRGPLARILGLLNLSDALVRNVTEAKHFFSIIKQQAESLDTILCTLTQSNNTRRRSLENRKLDFWQTIDRAIQKCRAIQGFGEVRFEKVVKCDTAVYSDQGMLEMMLTHLIENAIKYRRTDGIQNTVSISVSAYCEGVQIEVIDNGKGIPIRLQDKVFQMFYRSEADLNGNGLGLYMVRQFANKLGASLSLRSDTNNGAHFTILLNQDLQ